MPTNHQKAARFRMELEQPAGGSKFSVIISARGITWFLVYRIDLSDEKTARFSAEAQIINEMTDIESRSIDLRHRFSEYPFPTSRIRSLWKSDPGGLSPIRCPLAAPKAASATVFLATAGCPVE